MIFLRVQCRGMCELIFSLNTFYFEYLEENVWVFNELLLSLYYILVVIRLPKQIYVVVFNVQNVNFKHTNIFQYIENNLNFYTCFIHKFFCFCFIKSGSNRLFWNYLTQIYRCFSIFWMGLLSIGILLPQLFFILSGASFITKNRFEFVP